MNFLEYFEDQVKLLCNDLIMPIIRATTNHPELAKKIDELSAEYNSGINRVQEIRIYLGYKSLLNYFENLDEDKQDLFSSLVYGTKRFINNYFNLIPTEFFRGSEKIKRDELEGIFKLFKQEWVNLIQENINRRS